MYRVVFKVNVTRWKLLSGSGRGKLKGIMLSFSLATDTQVKARIDALKTQYGTLQAALDTYGISKPHSHRPQQKISLDISQVPPAEQAQLATTLLKSLSVIDKTKCIKAAFKDLNIDDADFLANMVFFELALKKDINTYPTDFAKLSSDAMMCLQKKNKPNLMHKFAKCIAECKPGSDEPLMPLDRMPFGLIQYQIEFFSCTNTSQVSHFYTLCMFKQFCLVIFQLTYSPNSKHSSFIILILILTFIHICDFSGDFLLI